MDTKFCHSCQQNLPISAFYLNAARPDGLSGHCAPCHRKATAAARDALRLKAIQYLGAVCAHCGFLDIRALVIDHVDGQGSKERKAIGPTKMHKRILAGAPGYQVLCCNCNHIKRMENGEHTGDRVYKRTVPDARRPTSRKHSPERKAALSATAKAASDAAGPEERARRAAAMAATRTGVPRARAEGQWSLRHEACVECKRTSQPHVGNGLCSTCTARKRREDRKAEAGTITL